MKKYIQCKICKKEMKQITTQHLKFHNMTISEYKNNFGNILSEEVYNKCSEAAKKGRPLAGVKKRQQRADQISLALKSYSATPARCKQCDTELKFEVRHNSFCSHSCSAKYSNSRRYPPKPTVVKPLCKKCHKPTNSKTGLHIECNKTACQNCSKQIYPNTTNLCRTCYIKSDRANEQRGRTFLKTRGYYESKSGIFYYMSNLELEFLKLCDQHNIKVEKPTPMPYYHDNREHLYFPDFKVSESIIEIKGYLTKEDKIKMSYFPEVLILFSKDISLFKETGVIPGV